MNMSYTRICIILCNSDRKLYKIKMFEIHRLRNDYFCEIGCKEISSNIILILYIFNSSDVRILMRIQNTTMFISYILLFES